jgi:AcrR family transcriptional regulator
VPDLAARPRGPRGADSDTRKDIVRAALALFSAHGFDGTSMRAIAKEAGVDPSLPRHYFPSKSALFVEALGPLDQIEDNLARIIPGPTELLGERLVTGFLNVWDSPVLSARLRTLVQTAVGTPEIADVARTLLVERLFVRIAKSVGPDDAYERAAATLSQMLGLVVTRYILRVEPIASAPRAEIIATFAPAVQRLITGTT